MGSGITFNGVSMATTKFVVLQNVKDGKLYIDVYPSSMQNESIELAYGGDIESLAAQYPNAIKPIKKQIVGKE